MIDEAKPNSINYVLAFNSPRNCSYPGTICPPPIKADAYVPIAVQSTPCFHQSRGNRCSKAAAVVQD